MPDTTTEMTPLAKLAYYVEVAFADLPADGMSDLSSTQLRAADMTFGDLREVLRIARAEDRSLALARREGKVEGIREAASLVEERSREAVTFRARAILADAANMLVTTAHLTDRADAIEAGEDPS